MEGVAKQDKQPKTGAYKDVLLYWGVQAQTGENNNILNESIVNIVKNLIMFALLFT